MSPPTKSNVESVLLEQFIKNLEETTQFTQQLLETVRESDLELNTLKIELKNLMVDVQNIMIILRDGGDGKVALVTNVALLEQRIVNVEKAFEKAVDKSSKEEVALTAADKAGKWQMRVAMFTGTIALLTTIGNTIFHYFKP